MRSDDEIRADLELREPLQGRLVSDEDFRARLSAEARLIADVPALLVGRDAARGIATQLEQENARLRAVVEAVAKTCGDVIAVEDFGQSRAIPPTRRLLAINLRAAAARGVL